MRTIRETYDLPKRPPTPFRQWAVMIAVPVALLALWAALPSSAAVVAILAILTLAAVFAGVAWVLRARQLSEPPPRRPTPPPSTQ
jgi:hypothetical protein